jgi:hypothetical protein
MKNIFKFMAIALVSSSMLFACGDKDNENDNNGENNNTTPTNTVKVTFGNINWEAASAQIYTGNLDEYGLVEYILAKDANAQTYPMVDIMVTATNGEYTTEATSEFETEDPNYPDGYTYYTFGDANIYSIDYYNTTAVQVNTASGTAIRGEWRGKSATLKVTAFDANALTASFNLTAVLYDYNSWYHGQVINAEDADEKDMTIVANNYKFTAAQ